MTTTDTPDTRERLLQTAGNLMWERSFQATGVDELCKQANARNGSFPLNFSSKSDLAIAAIAQSWAETKEAVFEPVYSGDDGGLDQLRNLGQRIYHFQRPMAADEIPSGINRQRAINLLAFMEGALLLAKAAHNPELVRNNAVALPVQAAN